MKNLKVITIITVFLVALSGTRLLAQGRPGGRPGKTSGARAAYGYPAESKSKKKKKKPSKEPKRKAKAPLYRKKSPWAN